MRKTYLFTIPTLVFALGCMGILNPAGAKFAEADAAAEAGDFVAAIKIYEAVQVGWPDSPEAVACAEAITVATVGLGEQQLELGQYLMVAAAVYILGQQGAAERASPEVTTGAQLGEAMKLGPEDPTTLGLAKGVVGGTTTGKVVDDAKLWTCDHLGDFPQVIACLNSELALDARTNRGEGCAASEFLIELCGDDDLAAGVLEWRTVSREQADERLATTKRLDGDCETWTRKLKQIERKWEYAVLTNRRGAAVSWMIEQRPYNEKMSEARGVTNGIEIGSLKRGWPFEIGFEVSAAARDSTCK